MTKSADVLDTTDLALVSVLVPVFNVERYVTEALESIAYQTYEKLQVIVVDDCSTDGTAEIVEEFCSRDPRFVLLRNESNQRIVVTLNHALQHANGQYIARCDGDDIMEPDRIARQMAFLNQHRDVDLVGCSLQFIDERGEAIGTKEYPGGSDLTHRLLMCCSPVSHIWLSRREVYDFVGSYRIPSVEDYDFLLRADLAGFKFDNVPRYFGMKIRIRVDNTVGRYGIVQRKLFNYARRIYLANKNRQIELYSEKVVMSIINHGGRGRLSDMHYLSDRVSLIAARRERSLIKFMLIACAASLSPYKFQYYANAVMRELIILFYRWSNLR